jgi:hypothetical protein
VPGPAALGRRRRIAAGHDLEIGQLVRGDIGDRRADDVDQRAVGHAVGVLVRSSWSQVPGTTDGTPCRGARRRRPIIRYPPVVELRRPSIIGQPYGLRRAPLLSSDR